MERFSLKSGCDIWTVASNKLRHQLQPKKTKVMLAILAANIAAKDVLPTVQGEAHQS